MYRLAHGLVDTQQFVSAGAASVAGIGARRTSACMPVSVLTLLAALGTEFSQQALTEHAQQGRRKQEGLDAHIQQSRHCRYRVIGMQGREHQMLPGQRRLNSDLRRFAVANLTDHDDIRILPQNSS